MVFALMVTLARRRPSLQGFGLLFLASCLCFSASLPFRNIAVDKKGNDETGAAIVPGKNGRARRVTSHAYQVFAVENGQNALVLLEGPKFDRGTVHLLYVEGETNGRRDLGEVPFRSAKLIELKTPNGQPAYILSGSSADGPRFVVADVNGVHGRVEGTLAGKPTAEAISYQDSRSKQTKTVSLEALLASDLTSIYEVSTGQGKPGVYVQLLRTGRLVLEHGDGSFEEGTWRTDGEMVNGVLENGSHVAWPESGFAAVTGVPAATRLSIRILQPLASQKVKKGDHVEAVLISPAEAENKIYLPQGSQFHGTVTDGHGVGWGLKHETAALTVEFNEATLPNGWRVHFHSRLFQVDNSQEKVDEKGDIHGVRSTGTIGQSAETKIASIANFDPIAYLFTTSAATGALGFAEPEILYPAGTELTIELEAPLITAKTYDKRMAEIATTQEQQNELAQFVRNLPFRTKTQAGNKESDVTNLVFIGPEAGLRRAFEAAGWLPADQLTAGTTFSTMKTLAGNETYRQAPMSMLLLDERPPILTLTKTTNTFSSRHHLRVFDPRARYDGVTAFTASSTQDIGIGFSREHKTFIHIIDQYIDNERSKIVNDLEFTGCVEAAQMLPRPWAPLDAYNSTGDRLRTDGEVAVLRVSECQSPRTTPSENAVPPNRTERIFRDTVLTLRNDIFRGNLGYQGFSTTRQATHYLAHRNDLKTDTGVWQKSDVSGTTFRGISTDPSRQPSVGGAAGSQLSSEAESNARLAEDHRWDAPRYEIALQGGKLRYPHSVSSQLEVDLSQSGSLIGLAALADAVSGGSWTAGISLTLNTWRWVSNEFAYQYQHSSYGYGTIGISVPALVEGLQTTEAGLSTRQFEYNVLVHARRREARWRPYVAIGPVFQLISLTSAPLKKPSKVFTLGLQNVGLLLSAFDFGGTAPLNGGGVFQVGVQYGGGLKVRIHPRIMLRADFRETLSKNPDILRKSYDESYFQGLDYEVKYTPAPAQGLFREQRISGGVAFTF